MAKTIDPQLQTMIDNMPKKTGRSLDDWYQTLKSTGLEKHGEILKFLKNEHDVSHGYANTISILFRQELEGGAPAEADLIDEQYADAKAGLKPIYNKIIKNVSKFGEDVEIAPKKTYVSLRRNKQFAIVQAATQKRVDLGLNLQDTKVSDRLEGGKVFSGMCTHRVRLTSPEEVDNDVISWLKLAYEQA